jgi:ERI1 exoribonuclease 3
MAARHRPPAHPEPAPAPAVFGGGRWDHLVVHSKRAPYDIYIGRRSRGAPAGATGEWGNPFAMTGEADRQRVIRQYSEWLQSQPELCDRARRELRGKVLGCWCAPKGCHGHVLAEVANSPAPSGNKTRLPAGVGSTAAVHNDPIALHGLPRPNRDTPIQARKRLGKKLADIAKLKERQQQQQQQLQPNQLAKIAKEGQLREELNALDEGLALVRSRSVEERAMRQQAEQVVCTVGRQHVRMEAEAVAQTQQAELGLGLAALAPQQTVARSPVTQDVGVAQPYDYYCVIDFEATCQERGRPRPQEIIELPSVLLDGRTMAVVDEFQLYVQPEYHPVLTEFCTELTGIQQEWVDGAPPFRAALHAHTQWLRRHGVAVAGAQGRSVIFVSCGDWDLKTMLPAQLGLYGERAPQHLRRWINIKHVYAQVMHRKASGMVEMLHGVRLQLEGRHHSGIDDCRNIARIVRALAQRGVVLECTASTVAVQAVPRPAHKRPRGKAPTGAGGAGRGMKRGGGRGRGGARGQLGRRGKLQ